jgi:hypothetical protein
MGTTKTTRKPVHCYVFKAQWRGTALHLRVEANDLEHAYRKAERDVLRMEGGNRCESVTLTRQEY